MPHHAVLSNYLWIPRAAVTGTPNEFAPEWVHTIPLLKTPEGKVAAQQIAVLRDQAILDGLDPDDVIKAISEEDNLTIRNWSTVGNWFALCAGNIRKVHWLCRRLNLELRDQRVSAPWDPELAAAMKMVMPPRDYQPIPFQAWMKADHGVFHAAPAFGKTYIMAWSVIERAQTALVLVPTDVLADQFINRFRFGSPKHGEDGFNPVTNCLEVEKATGRTIVGRYRGPDNIFPVTVATWQSFIGVAGRKALKLVAKKFGFVLFDEAHTCAAPMPASVVNTLHAKVKAGVTATPERKDKMEIGLYDVLGPVTPHASRRATNSRRCSTSS